MRTIITIFILLFFIVTVFGAENGTVPRMKLYSQPANPKVGDIFDVVMEIEWRGDPGLYRIDQPSVSPPENLKIMGRRSTVGSKNGFASRHVIIEMLPEKPGLFSIGPIDLSIRPSKGDEPIIVRSEKLSFEVTPKTGPLALITSIRSRIPHSRPLGIVLIIAALAVAALSVKMLVGNKSGNPTRNETRDGKQWSKTGEEKTNAPRKGDIQ